jgi:HD-GYP domain-containing protein (c-di-GMP phosphodiesterase class II)
MARGIDKQTLRSLVGLASVIEVRDPYTGGHCWRVGQFSKLLACSIGLDAEMVFQVSIGGVLHDLGKIAMPDAILRKPDRLNAEEYEFIRTHPTVGRDLLATYPLGDPTLGAVYHHHERIDGRGYPDGLEGEGIPLAARIVGLVDAFDAMTSSRPYREGMPIANALSILLAEAGRQIDSTLVEAFAALHQRDDLLAHIVGHSDDSQKLATCPACGPIIVLPRYFKDGSIAVCRNCTNKFVMHREGDSFVPEMMGVTASADELRPRPEADALETFVEAAPKPRSFFGWGLERRSSISPRG